MFANGWASDYIGVPFVEKGRTRDGWDCWGLVCAVYEEQLGIQLPLYLGSYDTTEDMASISVQIDEVKRVVPAWESVEDRKTGDVILCSVMGYETHLGVLVKPNVMLHAMDGRDTCLERIDLGSWSRRIRGAFRHV